LATFPRDELAYGTNLGKYEVLRRLAVGAMTEIYLARMRGAAGFEKLVVLKRILPHVANDELVAIFLTEARLAASLRHAQIADVLDVGTADGSYFLAREFVHGHDAGAILDVSRARGRRVPLDVALAIVLGTAAALAYAHGAGVVHRGVSSSNILASYEGAIKLVDFGIARATYRTRRDAGGLRTKIPYMSPEQVQGAPLDRRSDLFSLGVVLYELTVGVRPFRGATELAIMEQITNRNPAPPLLVVTGYPVDLERVVLKALARDVAQRYQQAHDLVEDLEHVVAKLELSTTSFAVGSFMHELFAEQIAASQAAARDGASLGEYLARSPAAERPTHAADAFAVATNADTIVKFEPTTLDEVTTPFGASYDNTAAIAASDDVAQRFRQLVANAREALAKREVAKAVVAVELALAEAPADDLERHLVAGDAAALQDCFDAFLGDPARIISLARPLEDLASVPLGARAAFLLSRVEGRMSIEDLVDTSGMPRFEACRYLSQLLLLGILR
jgi:hypothetical protein